MGKQWARIGLGMGKRWASWARWPSDGPIACRWAYPSPMHGDRPILAHCLPIGLYTLCIGPIASPSLAHAQAYPSPLLAYGPILAHCLPIGLA